ncbi:hypothetical protein ACH5RR_026461 [Cinchona calisaya]|uniref:Uncharacterized protein n=1 Tax=Cinchona calisaya TaxID=153742 RepID=A0ABD2Z4R3_9GENT
MENGKGKSEFVEGESSNELWAGSFKKKGSVIPKKRTPVSHMVGEKIGKVVVSGVQKINNKKKINPDEVTGALEYDATWTQNDGPNSSKRNLGRVDGKERRNKALRRRVEKKREVA